MIGKREVKGILALAILACVIFAFASGLISNRLDLHRFVYHEYSAYLAAFLTAIHVYLNRRSLLLCFRRGSLPGREEEEGSRASTRGEGQASLLSRRGMLIGLLAGTGGFLLGRVRLSPTPVSGQDIGQIYHQWSKPGYTGLLSQALDWSLPPPLYKTYTQAEKIPLPDGFDYRGLYLEEAIEKRRSIRDFSPEPLPLSSLSNLLHYAEGITLPGSYPLRAAPSAGALYPVEIYPVVHNVESLKPGVYHYAVQEHALELIKEGDFRQEMVQHAVGQEMVGRANVAFILTAIFQRTRWKYGPRAYRYILLEAGHIGENIYLAATSLGLGACAVGAFFDDGLNRLLGVDGEQEAAIYLLIVGRIEVGSWRLENGG